MEKKQFNLFNEEVKEDWEKEWKDMPEFLQEDREPWKQIKVSFENQEDMKKFAELLNQTITLKTRSVWYPKAEIETLMDKRYTTEEKKDIA